MSDCKLNSDHCFFFIIPEKRTCFIYEQNVLNIKEVHPTLQSILYSSIRMDFAVYHLQSQLSNFRMARLHSIESHTRFQRANSENCNLAIQIEWSEESI